CQRLQTYGGLTMSGYRLGLLSSASSATLAFAAELTGGLGPQKRERKRSKSRGAKLQGNSGRRLLVNGAGAGAFAVALAAGLTAAPQETFAVPASACYIVGYGGDAQIVAGENAFTCGRNAIAIGDNSTALGTHASAIGTRSTAVGTYAQAKYGNY